MDKLKSYLRIIYINKKKDKCIETLLSLLNNLNNCKNDSESDSKSDFSKFNTIRLSNKIINKYITTVPGAIEFLEELHFKRIYYNSPESLMSKDKGPLEAYLKLYEPDCDYDLISVALLLLNNPDNLLNVDNFDLVDNLDKTKIVKVYLSNGQILKGLFNKNDGLNIIQDWVGNFIDKKFKLVYKNNCYYVNIEGDKSDENFESNNISNFNNEILKEREKIQKSIDDKKKEKILVKKLREETIQQIKDDREKVKRRLKRR